MNEWHSVGVLAHPQRPQTAPVAERVAATLRARGIPTWVYSVWDEETISAQVAQAHFVVAIGGDGAMLRAARVCAQHQVPVLGLNMGRLGFLTEVNSPDEWGRYLERLLSEEYWIETRMMLRVTVAQNGADGIQGDALNDVVISGSSIGRMIQLDAYIDGDWTTTYNSDALIVATATGSTAYALAVGGPILPPDLRNILIVPTAPHLSMDRAIVLSEGSQVLVRPAEARGRVLVSADGAPLAELHAEDCVRIVASPHEARFIRMRGRNYFYRSLLDRLEPRVNRPKTSPENNV